MDGGVTELELILARHGESTANVARERAEAIGAEVIEVEARDADVSLSRLGALQAKALGAQLGRGLDAGRDFQIWSSPYLRAARTAELATAELAHISRVRIDERLRDRELGILDTLTSVGVRVRHPEEADRRRRLGKFYYRPPGGESWADIALRLRSFLDELTTGTVLLFTHDAVVTMIRYVCLGLGEIDVLDLAAQNPIGNASISRLVRHGGVWSVAEYNAQGHLVLADGRDLRTAHPGDTDVHPQ